MSKRVFLQEKSSDQPSPADLVQWATLSPFFLFFFPLLFFGLCGVQIRLTPTTGTKHVHKSSRIFYGNAALRPKNPFRLVLRGDSIAITTLTSLEISSLGEFRGCTSSLYARAQVRSASVRRSKNATSNHEAWMLPERDKASLS